MTRRIQVDADDYGANDTLSRKRVQDTLRRGGSLKDADLRGVDLKLAKMEGASIHGAHISGAYFPNELSADEIELSLRTGTRMRYR